MTDSPKLCPECGAVVAVPGKRQKYCSVACRQAVAARRPAKAKHRRLREGTCPECEKSGLLRWVRGVCNACYLRHYHAGTTDVLKAPRKVIVPCSIVVEEKPCCSCKVVKQSDRFSRSKATVDGLGKACKDCQAALRKAKPEHYRNFELQRNYGITSEEYDQMYYDQDGLCLICSEEEPGGRLMPVDHCHATGKVRGLLCANCNRGLGLFKDDPDRLLAAAMYLLRQTDALAEVGGD